MTSMVDIRLYTNPAGMVDWHSLEQAERKHGSRCSRCPAYFVVGFGEPRLCHQCEDAALAKELGHDHFARCPTCSHLFKPEHRDRLDREDEIGLTCPKCEHEFEVQVRVTYHYTSPALTMEAA